jgi:hypothetical protein
MKEKEFDMERIKKEMFFLMNGEYEYFFKETERECEQKYIPFAFASVYEWLLTGILENGVFQDFYSLSIHGADDPRLKSYDESMKNYEQKKKKLDKVMIKYAKKYLVLPDNVTIEEFLKFRSDIKKTITELFANKINDNTLTDLQHHLIKKTFVLNDGRTANSSLNVIACEVRKYYKNEPVTWQYLQENFLKRNGEKFSQSYCENARDLANK